MAVCTCMHIFYLLKNYFIYCQRKESNRRRWKPESSTFFPQNLRDWVLWWSRVERVIITLATLVYVHWCDYSYIFMLNMRLKNKFFNIILWWWRVGHDLKNSDIIRRAVISVLFSFPFFQIVLAWKLFWLVNHRCPVSIMLHVLH